MSVFKNGKFYHYEFFLDGRWHRGSTGATSKAQAIKEERRQRERLEKSYSQVIDEEAREQRRKTIKEAADDFLLDYKLKHECPTFAEYALGHVTDLLGKKLVVEITPTVVKRYQADRLAEKAGPKTINDEVLLLLRLCGDQGDLIRAKLRREKSMKLKTPPSPGRAYTADEKSRMLAEAQKLRSKNIYPALVVDLNCGLRDKELRELRWQQVDLVHKKTLTVGKSKTEAGTGRVIPLNDAVLNALQRHAGWYIKRFGECRPEWFVFPAGKGQPNDPTKPVTTLKTAWIKVRKNAKVVGRWHDNRHTLVTELAESGAGDEVIMSIAGHVSHAMLHRYSHVRMEAKRRALEEIAARQRAADEKRRAEAERLEQADAASETVAVQ
ncbi:MAG: site-specific integrase [Acidobacteria bacterium]|nr:site-specific integrase [Acidobacteriota bacterium]